MIGYFLIADEIGGRALNAALWQSGFAHEVKAKINAKQFSREIELILIEIHVESHLSLGIPEKITVGRKSKIDKSLAVKIPLERSLALQSESKLYEIIKDITLQALDAISNKLNGAVDVDFVRLRETFIEVADQFIAHARRHDGNHSN